MMSINLVTFLSFCWYFLVSTEITPLAIAPVRDAAPNGMLTGNPMNVANVATLDIPGISEDLIMDMKNTQTQTDDSLPMQELLGLDAQLRSIRGLLIVEEAKRLSWKNTSRKSNESSRESENILESTTMGFEKTSPSESTL